MSHRGILDAERFAPPATEGRAMGSRDRSPAWVRRGARPARHASAEPAAEAVGPPETGAAPPPDSAPSRQRRPPSPEERTLREARNAAARKMGFLGHFVPYAAVCTFLLFVAGFRAAFIVALAWGIGIAIHFFFAIVAPELHRRLFEQEIDRRVQAGVREERRSLEDRHARDVARLSASLAHEIRNPITAARSLVQQMGEDPGSRDHVEYARVALDELGRVERSISHLLRFAREEDLRLEEIDLADVVEGALEVLAEPLEARGLAVERDLDPVLLRGDFDKLRRVVVNLVRNAADAMEDAGTPRPRLRLETGTDLAGAHAWLRVRDDGPGMDAEQLDRIWDPYVTSKDDGAGLGLAITRKLVEAHRGAIEVESEPGAGTAFVVTLPRDPEATAEPEEETR